MFAKTVEYFKNKYWTQFEEFCNMISKLRFHEDQHHDPKIVKFYVFCLLCRDADCNELLYEAHTRYKFGLNTAISETVQMRINHDFTSPCLLPLHSAILRNNVELIDFLLRKGAFLYYPLRETIACAMQASLDTFQYIADMMYFGEEQGGWITDKTKLTEDRIAIFKSRGADLCKWNVLGHCDTINTLRAVSQKYDLPIDKTTIVDLIKTYLIAENYSIAEYLMMDLKIMLPEMDNILWNQYDEAYRCMCKTDPSQDKLRDLFIETFTQLIVVDGKTIYVHASLTPLNGTMWQNVVRFGPVTVFRGTPSTPGFLSRFFTSSSNVSKK